MSKAWKGGPMEERRGNSPPGELKLEELEELKRILEDRARLLDMLAQREREVRALNERSMRLLNERARMIEELEQRNQEITALLNLAQSVSSSLDPDEVVSMALERLRRPLGIESCYLQLLEDGKLVLKGQHGFTRGIIEGLARLDINNSIGGEVLRSGRPLILPDLSSRSEADLAALLKGGYKSYVGLPLQVRGEHFGILGIAFRFERSPSERELELFSTVALTIATALQNALLYEKSREEEQELSFISRLTGIIASSLDLNEVYDGFILELRKHMSVDWGGVVLIEGDKVRLNAVSGLVEPLWRREERVPLKGTGTEWVAQNKRTLVEDDLTVEKKFWTGERHLKAGVRSIVYLPLILHGECFGSLILGSRHPRAYGPREVKLLEHLAAQLAPHLMNHRMYGELQESLRREKIKGQQLRRARRELEQASLETVEALVRVVEAHEPFNRGHGKRVARLCREIGAKMGLSREELRMLELAGQLHEVGKITVPDEVLFKPKEERTPEEEEEFRAYVISSVELLRRLSFLKETLPYIEAHCERYDGSGYPRGLKREEIPLGARILAVADAYVAMTSERPWRPPLSREQALRTLKEEAGTKWDPRVVETLLNLVPELD